MCRGCRAVRFWQHLFGFFGFQLLGWQEKFVRRTYGTVDPADGRRQYRNVYESVAKKNGKSFLFGAMPLYHLAFEVDQEPRPLEAYGAAAAERQAGIVFEAAAQLLDACGPLKSVLRCIPSGKRIIRRDGRGTYRVISSDGDVSDGAEPSLGIIDELHRWKTPKARILHAVLHKGGISRSEPLIAAISTAGEEFECPLWQSEHERARRIQDGIIKPRRIFGEIFSADEKKLQNDPEYWKSKEARLAANPSHEDFGGFLRDEDLVDERDEAIEDPSRKADYLRYNLNVMVNQSEQRAIDIDRWKQCGGGVDLRTWPEFDPDLLIRKWGLLDKPCYAGIDMSATTDLTAVALVFPPDLDGPWSILAFPFMAEGQVTEREKRDKVPYLEWIRRGFLEATPGYEITSEPVVRRVKWAAEMFDLKEVCFDRYNATPTRNALIDEGLVCVEINQTTTWLNQPCRKLLGLYQDPTKLRHGNHPVFNFCASCLALKSDTNDLVRPSKPDRQRSSRRVDLISATVTAMYRIMACEQMQEIGFAVVG